MSFISTFNCHLAPQGQRWIQFHGGGDFCYVQVPFWSLCDALFLGSDWAWGIVMAEQSREPPMKPARTPRSSPISAEEPLQGPESVLVNEKDICPETGGNDVGSLKQQSFSPSLYVCNWRSQLCVYFPIQKG